MPRLSEVSLDGTVLAFALAVAVLTGVVFGLVPALTSSKLAVHTALKEGGRTSSQGGRRPLLRQTLVVVEMALAVVLVVGAGLLINSFVRLLRVDPGYRAQNVLVVPLSLPTSRYEEHTAALSFFEQLREQLAALPGVDRVATGYQHPLSGGWETSFEIKGLLEVPPGERPEARIRPVDPRYFRTVGIPLVQGRHFTDQDREGTPNVVIINESFARQFFTEVDPIGQRLLKSPWWDFQTGEWEIVGVVGDVKMDGLESGTPWAWYFPHQQMPFNDMYVFASTAGDPLALAPSVRNAVWSLDPNLPVENIQTLDGIRSASVAAQRFQMALLGIFAALAIILAAVGVYGVLSYAVAQRTREIGVRLSLGARTSDVLRLVIKQGMGLSLIGLALGIGGALALTRLTGSLLFGVSPTDPATFVAVASTLTLVALAACAVPALRASRVDPVTALRAE